ncbi:Dabb family protein [Salmonella enterica]|nr:Dabb family protein [Salmonella enterica]
MIKHLLIFSFNLKATEIDILRIKTTFLTTPERVSGVVSVEWGESNNPENQNFSHCISIVFNRSLARDSYLEHDEYINLKKSLKPFILDIMEFDYYCYL